SNLCLVSASIILFSGVFGISLTSCLTTFCKHKNRLFVPGIRGNRGFSKNSCRYGCGSSANLRINPMTSKLISYVCLGMILPIDNSVDITRCQSAAVILLIGKIQSSFFVFLSFVFLVTPRGDSTISSGVIIICSRSHLQALGDKGCDKYDMVIGQSGRHYPLKKHHSNGPCQCLGKLHLSFSDQPITIVVPHEERRHLPATGEFFFLETIDGSSLLAVVCANEGSFRDAKAIIPSHARILTVLS
ncbi:hypothetical protein ALC60_14806, partial [Trachymyrmex zeteki]